MWRNRLRWNALLCGAFIFFWSAIEDNDLTAVVLLGIWLSATLISLWGMTLWATITFTHPHAPLFSLMLGAGMGILTSITMTGLMLFKNLRHSHLFPDYPFEMLRDIIGRAPFWALGGASIALGIYLLGHLIKQKSDV